MENIKVGEMVETTGTINYKTKLEAILNIDNKEVYIFNDESNYGGVYIRGYEKKELDNYFRKIKVEEVEELTVEQISERLGKTIKVVK